MDDVRAEPSMEDILASIKRIIADEGAAAVAAPRTRKAAEPKPAPEPAAVAPDPVLELTTPAPATDAAGTELLSDTAASASRQSLAALSKVVVRTDPVPDNTLESLVRELLKPMLKEWLDARLPELVEGLVSREIARLTGHSF